MINTLFDKLYNTLLETKCDDLALLKLVEYKGHYSINLLNTPVFKFDLKGGKISF